MIPHQNDCNFSFPSSIEGMSFKPSLVHNYRQIFLCGGSGNLQKCLTFKNGNWSNHSDLNEKRRYATAIFMQKGIYIFGGSESPTTWEWLPKGNTSWQMGNERIPYPGFYMGCGIRISANELLLIGGKYTEKQILKFNTNTNKFEKLTQTLEYGRNYHTCIKFKNTIIVSGGYSYTNVTASTEILKLKDLSSTTNAGMDMKVGREGHGLVVVYHHNKLTLLAIGGDNGVRNGRNYVKWTNFDTIEIWHHAEKNWSLAKDLKLLKPTTSFGFLSVPTRLVCSP